MTNTEAVKGEFDGAYAAAERVLSEGDVSSYLTAREQIWKLYDKLDKLNAAGQRRHAGKLSDGTDDDSQVNALVRHLRSAQGRLDETIVRTWNDGWNEALQAYLAENPHTPAYKPGRVTKPSDFEALDDDPRYGLGNIRYTRENILLARMRLKEMRLSRAGNCEAETRPAARSWWAFWRAKN